MGVVMGGGGYGRRVWLWGVVMGGGLVMMRYIHKELWGGGVTIGGWLWEEGVAMEGGG